MTTLSELDSHLLFLFNVISILVISWFASWTYLYSFSGLYDYVSATDFRNIVITSMLITTLIIVNGAAMLRKLGVSIGINRVQTEQQRPKP